MIKESLDKIGVFLRTDTKHTLFFLNADCLRQTQRDRHYLNILNSADLVLSDGIGLRFATWLFGGRMKDNCNGTDLSPLIMKEAAKQGLRVFFLGGKEGIAEKAADNIKNKVSGIQIVGVHSGYFEDDDEVINKINLSGADILFVAMGVPLQEKWITKNRDKLNSKLCLGVGALFDYLSEHIRRAPKIMINLHLEWLWRIFIEPRRMFKRYILDGLGFFIYLIFYRIKQIITT